MCSIVGYHNMVVDLNNLRITRGRNAVWGKLEAIMVAFAQYPSTEWVWWLDIDAFITNPHLDLHEHLLDPDVLSSRLIEGDAILPNSRIQAVGGHELKTAEVLPYTCLIQRIWIRCKLT
jgi:hypothetical protein